MKVEVLSGDARVSQVVRATVVRGVRLALSRFGRRVLKVSVRIAGAANPLEGTDQRCQMRAWLQAAGDVRAEAINGKMDVAVGRAAARLATSIAWALDDGHGASGASPPGNIENGVRGRPRVTAQRPREPRRQPAPSVRARTSKTSRVRSGKP